MQTESNVPAPAAAGKKPTIQFDGPVPTLRAVALTLVHEGENTRKVFDAVKLQELAADIKIRGVLQPPLVRPDGNGGFDLVIGARRYRGSKLAGLETIVVMIKPMTDLEVLETQIAENDKRADLHPLEEAEAYRALHEKHGFTVEEIAAKVSKSVPAVYARLKLCSLCKEGKDAFYAGKLTAGTAIFVARIPSEDLQREALAKIEQEAEWLNEDVDDDEDEPRAPAAPLGVRDASRIMQSHFMLRLEGAPFDRADATLLPAAGACSTCPKRTGAQPELFADVKTADTCTDPKCFSDKKAAAVAKTLKEAKKSGQRVLTKEESKAVFPFGSHVAGSAPYVDLAEKNFSGGGSGKTFKAILGKDAPQPILAVDGDGKLHELVPRALATKALRAANKTAEKRNLSKNEKSAQNSARNQFNAEEEGGRRAIAELASKAAATEPPTLWRAIAVELCDLCYDADLEAIAERLKLKSSLSRTLQAAALKMTASQARGLALELLASNAMSFSGAGSGTFLDAIFPMFKIDVKKHAAAAQAEETKARVAPAEKKSAAAKVAKPMKAKAKKTAK